MKPSLKDDLDGLAMSPMAKGLLPTKSLTEYWLMKSQAFNLAPIILGRYTRKESALLETTDKPGTYVISIERLTDMVATDNQNQEEPLKSAKAEL